MKIWPTSVFKRAAQLFISSILGIAAFTILSWAVSLLSNSKNLMPDVSGFTSVILVLMSFVFGLYIAPAISRLFIRYLLLRSSGNTLTKPILYKEIQPDNSVRFIVLNFIISLPIIASGLMGFFSTTASLYMMGIFALVIFGFIYLYSRIFIAHIIMVDRTATIDQSLKQAVTISKEYPINSIFFALVILALYSVNISYVQLFLFQKIHIPSSLLTQMFISTGIRAMTEVLAYVISTALYIEVKRRKNLHF